ncbi:MAG: hypothetical protein JO263_03265 [Candidatus Eremiobacteraeota bacterium]|nr:hypothetical protein [Candidatus Eremiobacteraeota bacterium]
MRSGMLVAAAAMALCGAEKAIASITSVIERGRYREGTFRIDTFAAQLRPFYRVIGDPLTDPLGEIHEEYDGSAWEYYPDPGIVVRTVGAAWCGTREDAIRTTLADGFTEEIYVNPATWMIDEDTGTTLTESAVTSVEINASPPLSMFSRGRQSRVRARSRDRSRISTRPRRAGGTEIVEVL